MFGKKKVLFDTILSFSATMILQVVVQFIIYPFFERGLGSGGYGELVYLMTFVNIVAEIGSSVSLERMKISAEKLTYNGDFAKINALFFLPVIPAAFIYLFAGHVHLGIAETICFIFLCLFAMLRSYFNVDFRLSLNYTKYFLYFLSIAVGYILGLTIWGKSGNWINVILLGEIFASLFIIFFSDHLKKKPFEMSEESNRNILLALPVVTSGLMTAIIFNMDRILLKIICSSEEVALFYIAGLFGKTMSLVSMPLNNVAIGYLAKYKGKFTVGLLMKIVLIAIVFGALATGACTVGSYIVIPFLYPETSVEASKYYLIANISSIIYFITGFFGVILLRYGKERCQLYANIVYAVAFFALCVPACIFWGIKGLCYALIAVTFCKFSAVIIMCISEIKKREKEELTKING
ncbi:MAG: hypothetical protein E7384_02650 [Ruminococcaceae bacterium]|nr:hypothetical protein [Oscillospiraceae bacterium]